MVRAIALALIVLLVGCGSETVPEPPPEGAALPVGGVSWIAGDRTNPSAGRITVGLLVNRRKARRLADLIPKDKLESYLAA